MNRTAASPIAGGSGLLNRDLVFRLRLAWRLWRDERVSKLKYGIPALLALYLFSPVDVIPDWLLGAGQGDDVGFAVATVFLFARIMPKLAPASVVHEHVRTMRRRRGVRGARTPAADHVVDASYFVRT